MSEQTIARPVASESGHWYKPDGTPAYTVAKKDGSGDRPTTLRDARKMNLVPSVTTILKVLHKQALVQWLIEQAVLVAVTSPRLPGEELDAFIERVLHTEKQQDVESQKARDLGTDIHAAIERAVTGETWDEALAPHVNPVLESLKQFGEMRWAEKVIVGNGYAGKTDYIAEDDKAITVVDFKTAKTLPKDEPWDEHKLQLAAYASGLGNTGEKPIRTVNIYISTKEHGKLKVVPSDDWSGTLHNGFLPLVKYWQWVSGYSPKQLTPTKISHQESAMPTSTRRWWSVQNAKAQVTTFGRCLGPSRESDVPSAKAQAKSGTTKASKL